MTTHRAGRPLPDLDRRLIEGQRVPLAASHVEPAPISDEAAQKIIRNALRDMRDHAQAAGGRITDVQATQIPMVREPGAGDEPPNLRRAELGEPAPLVQITVSATIVKA